MVASAKNYGQLNCRRYITWMEGHDHIHIQVSEESV